MQAISDFFDNLTGTKKTGPSERLYIDVVIDGYVPFNTAKV